MVEPINPFAGFTDEQVKKYLIHNSSLLDSAMEEREKPKGPGVSGLNREVMTRILIFSDHHRSLLSMNMLSVKVANMRGVSQKTPLLQIIFRAVEWLIRRKKLKD